MHICWNVYANSCGNICGLVCFQISRLLKISGCTVCCWAVFFWKVPIIGTTARWRLICNEIFNMFPCTYCTTIEQRRHTVLTRPTAGMSSLVVLPLPSQVVTMPICFTWHKLQLLLMPDRKRVRKAVISVPKTDTNCCHFCRVMSGQPSLAHSCVCVIGPNSDNDNEATIACLSSGGKSFRVVRIYWHNDPHGCADCVAILAGHVAAPQSLIIEKIIFR